jgi:pyrimidine-specific ribonucleoside hydrolase
MRKLIPFLFALTIAGPIAAQDKKSEPTPIIFDTDMGPDYDDVGAITMLHAFADSGKCRILATMASDRYSNVAAVLSVFNSYFHRADIPIGVPGGNAPDIRDEQHWSDTILAKYPHKIKANSDASNAVALYRKILAAQPDHSVVIVTVGFQTNLAGLLGTKPDANSALDGLQLVKKKVKLLVCMAGAFPGGREFNIYSDAAAAGSVSKSWPGPIIYSGFEIGKKIKTGIPLINNAAIRNSPVKDVFRIGIHHSAEDTHGRMSWDETAVLVAVAGAAPWYTVKRGHIVIDTQGANTWQDATADNAQHAYLVEALPAATVQNMIDRLIQHQPTQR